MRQVYVSTVFDQPVDDVWAVLGDFHRVDKWIGIVHASEPENGDQAPTIGSVRKLTVGDDRHTTRERLASYDAVRRQMTYELPEAPPWNMTHYLGTIRVLPVTDSGKTFVEWYGQYACDDVADVPTIEANLSGIYSAFLADLRQYLGSPA
jgi:Polyketide cyclase / dehydrase and lipid transport